MNVINYIDAEIKFADKGKVRQAVKLAEWANVEFEKNRGIKHEINGTSIKKINGECIKLKFMRKVWN